MRLKRASLTLAGAAAAVAVTTMAAAPAWACSDRDPALKLRSLCGKDGQPAWLLTNPNGWGAVPATWTDNKGGRSEGKISVPARGTVLLATHATKVIVTAFRPDRGNREVWQRHGAFGLLQQHCKGTKPTAPNAPDAPKAPEKPKPAPKPTKTGEAPKPATPPSGEARPATPVKAQPAFTG
jgi:hypothetical protein